MGEEGKSWISCIRHPVVLSCEVEEGQERREFREHLDGVVIDMQGDAFALRVVNGRVESLKEGWRASDRVASEFKGGKFREEAEDVVDGIQYDHY